VLILYAINDHRARIEVGYGLERFCQMARPADFSGKPFRSCGRATTARLCCLVTSRVAGVYRAGRRRSAHHPDTRPGSVTTGAATGRRISAGGIVLLIIIVLCCFFLLFASSRHTFSGCLFLACLAWWVSRWFWWRRRRFWWWGRVRLDPAVGSSGGERREQQL